MEIEFDKPPPVGYTHERYDNRYVLAEVRPYVRKLDGAPSFLLTWVGSCATCGCDFSVISGLRTKALNRRCKDHVEPLRAATKSARAATRKGRDKGRKLGIITKKAAKAEREPTAEDLLS